MGLTKAQLRLKAEGGRRKAELRPKDEGVRLKDEKGGSSSFLVLRSSFLVPNKPFDETFDQAQVRSGQAAARGRSRAFLRKTRWPRFTILVVFSCGSAGTGGWHGAVSPDIS